MMEGIGLRQAVPYGGDRLCRIGKGRFVDEEGVLIAHGDNVVVECALIDRIRVLLEEECGYQPVMPGDRPARFQRLAGGEALR
jgi:hypothetical protein